MKECVFPVRWNPPKHTKKSSKFFYMNGRKYVAFCRSALFYLTSYNIIKSKNKTKQKTPNRSKFPPSCRVGGSMELETILSIQFEWRATLGANFDFGLTLTFCLPSTVHCTQFRKRVLSRIRSWFKVSAAKHVPKQYVDVRLTGATRQC